MRHVARVGAHVARGLHRGSADHRSLHRIDDDIHRHRAGHRNLAAEPQADRQGIDRAGLVRMNDDAAGTVVGLVVEGRTVHLGSDRIGDEVRRQGNAHRRVSANGQGRPAGERLDAGSIDRLHRDVALVLDGRRFHMGIDGIRDAVDRQPATDRSALGAGRADREGKDLAVDQRVRFGRFRAHHDRARDTLEGRAFDRRGNAVLDQVEAHRAAEARGIQPDAERARDGLEGRVVFGRHLDRAGPGRHGRRDLGTDGVGDDVDAHREGDADILACAGGDAHRAQGVVVLGGHFHRAAGVDRRAIDRAQRGAGDHVHADGEAEAALAADPETTSAGDDARGIQRGDRDRAVAREGAEVDIGLGLVVEDVHRHRTAEAGALATGHHRRGDRHADEVTLAGRIDGDAGRIQIGHHRIGERIQTQVVHAHRTAHARPALVGGGVHEGSRAGDCQDLHVVLGDHAQRAARLDLARIADCRDGAVLHHIDRHRAGNGEAALGLAAGFGGHVAVEHGRRGVAHLVVDLALVEILVQAAEGRDDARLGIVVTASAATARRARLAGGCRAGNGKGPQFAVHRGAQVNRIGHVDGGMGIHRGAHGLREIRIADDRVGLAVEIADRDRHADAGVLADRHATDPVRPGHQVARVDARIPAGDHRRRAEVGERMAGLLHIGHRAGHRGGAAGRAALGHVDGKVGLFGLHVEAAVGAAVDLGVVGHDRLGGIGEDAHHHRAAHAALGAARPGRQDVQLVQPFLLGGPVREIAKLEGRQLHVAGHVDGLGVVGGLDRDHLFVHETVGIGPVHRIGVVLVGVVVERIIAPVEVLVDRDLGLHGGLGGVVEHHDVEGARDAELLGLGGGGGPGVEPGLETQGRIELTLEHVAHVLGDRTVAVGADAVAEFAEGGREIGVRTHQVGIGDVGNHPRRTQRVEGRELGMGRVAEVGMDRRAGGIVEHRHGYRDAGHGVGAALGVVAVGIGLGLGIAVGAELVGFCDGALDLEIFVGFEDRGRAHLGGGRVGANRHRQRTGDGEFRGLGIVARLVVAVVLLHEALEQRIGDVEVHHLVVAVLVAVPLALLVVRRLALALESATGAGLVLGVELGDHADTGGEARIEHVLGREGETAPRLGDRPDVDIHAAARLVLGLRELDHLPVAVAGVALQVLFVGARHHVVGGAVVEPLDDTAVGVIDHGLAELELVDVAGRVGRVAQAQGIRAAVHVAAHELALVDRDRNRTGTRLEVDDDTALFGDGFRVAGLDGLALGRSEHDPLGFVAGGIGIVLERDDVVVLAVHKRVVSERIVVADAVAVAVGVVDDVLVHQGVRPHVDHVLVVIHIADIVFIGDRGVDLDLHHRAVREVGLHRTIYRRMHGGIGNLDTEGQRCRAIGEHPALGLCLGRHIAIGDDVGGLRRIHLGTCSKGHRGRDIGVGHRQGDGDLLAARVGRPIELARSARAQAGACFGTAGDDHRRAVAGDGHTRLHVHRSGGHGAGVAHAEDAALRHARSIRHGRRVDAHRVAAVDGRIRADVDRRGGVAHQHLHRQCEDAGEVILQGLDDEVRDCVARAEQGGEVAVFRLGDEVDPAAVERGTTADVDRDLAVRTEDRRQVLEVGGGDAARTEHDIAHIAGALAGLDVMPLPGIQGDIGADRDLLGIGLDATAVGRDAAGELDGVDEGVIDRDAQRIRRIAEDDEVGGEQRIE